MIYAKKLSGYYLGTAGKVKTKTVEKNVKDCYSALRQVNAGKMEPLNLF